MLKQITIQVPSWPMLCSAVHLFCELYTRNICLITCISFATVTIICSDTEDVFSYFHVCCFHQNMVTFLVWQLQTASFEMLARMNILTTWKQTWYENLMWIINNKLFDQFYFNNLNKMYNVNRLILLFQGNILILYFGTIFQWINILFCLVKWFWLVSQ